MKNADWLDVAADRDLIGKSLAALELRAANQRPRLPKAHSGESIVTGLRLCV